MEQYIKKSDLVAEIERLREKNNESENVYDFGTEDALKSILSFINSVQEEPISKELEEAAFDYAEACKYDGGEKLLCVEHFNAGAKWQKEQFEKNRLKHCDSITNKQAELEQGFIDQHLDKNKRMPTFLDAIEYGMNLQKEQMTNSAKKSKIVITSGGILLSDLKIEDFDYADKVKVIIIKENKDE